MKLRRRSLWSSLSVTESQKVFGRITEIKIEGEYEVVRFKNHISGTIGAGLIHMDVSSSLLDSITVHI